MAVVGVVVVIYMLATKSVTLNNLVPFVLTLANTWGLLNIILMLGYGLVEVPRMLWHESNPEQALRRLQFKAPDTDLALFDARCALEEVVAQASDVIDVVTSCPLCAWLPAAAAVVEWRMRVRVCACAWVCARTCVCEREYDARVCEFRPSRWCHDSSAAATVRWSVVSTCGRVWTRSWARCPRRSSTPQTRTRCRGPSPLQPVATPARCGVRRQRARASD
jgi:hypothetical protein